MRVGRELLELARAQGARAIFVAGTGKGVGKTTALTSIYEAACEAGLRVGLASIGHRPRMRLRARTLFVTARPLLPRSPAVEILDTTRLESSAGPLLYARSAYDGFYELIGSSSASGLRESLAVLASRSDIVLVDGAIDRLATLAAGDGAIVLACGAAAAKTVSQAVADFAALVARLRIRPADEFRDAIALDGALTASLAAALLASGERRQIVVRDATQIVMSGASLEGTLRRLDVRCRRPLHVVAATVCSVAPERSFEPASFLREVAVATGLPTFDVFAGARAA